MSAKLLRIVVWVAGASGWAAWLRIGLVWAAMGIALLWASLK